MKVKIIKSSTVDYWYSDRIGEVFEVNNYSDDRYIVLDERVPTLSFILKEDTVQENPKERTILQVLESIESLLRKHFRRVGSRENRLL